MSDLTYLSDLPVSGIRFVTICKTKFEEKFGPYRSMDKQPKPFAEIATYLESAHEDNGKGNISVNLDRCLVLYSDGVHLSDSASKDFSLSFEILRRKAIMSLATLEQGKASLNNIRLIQ